MAGQRRLALALSGWALLCAGPGQAASGACPAREETFYTRLTEDFLTHSIGSGAGGTAPFPASMPRMTEPALAYASAVAHKIRNARGEVIGVATQMAWPGVDARGERVGWTSWTVMIPGRGALFLQQGEVVRPVLETLARLKSDPKFTGDDVITTVGPRADGRGVVVGGSGAFEGCTGSFLEVERLRDSDPSDMVAMGMRGWIELRVRFGG